MRRRGRGEGGARRSPARFLAPVALIAVIIGTIVVVESGLSRAPKASSSTRSAPTTPASTTPARHGGHPATYTVKAGDTLGVIAERTHVPEGTIESLNPHLDPNSLHPGQRLRIRR